MHSRALAVVVLAAVCAAAPATAALSPDRYHRELRAICADAKQRAARIPDPDTPAKARRSLALVIPLFERFRAQVAALEPPPALAATQRSVVTAFAREVVLMRAVQRRVLRGESFTSAFVQEAGDEGARLQKAVARDFRRLGAPGCAD